MTKRLLCVAVFLSTLSEAATAAIIFDDLADANPTAASLVGYYPPQMIKNVVQGIQFQPQLHPPGISHRVTEYAVAFRKHASLPAPLVTFRLYDDAAGKPGSVLDVAHVTMDVEGFDGATYRIASTMNPAISSVSSYWLIANVDDLSNGALWHHALNANAAKTKAIRNANGDWRVFQNPNGPAIQVVGEPVPEPTTCVLTIVLGALLKVAPHPPQRRLGCGACSI